MFKFLFRPKIKIYKIFFSSFNPIFLGGGGGQWRTGGSDKDERLWLFGERKEKEGVDGEN